MMTTEPPLSAFLMVMCLLLARLCMARCCSCWMSGKSVGPPNWAMRVMFLILLVICVSWRFVGIGGSQVDLVWNCGVVLWESLKW